VGQARRRGDDDPGVTTTLRRNAFAVNPTDEGGE